MAVIRSHHAQADTDYEGVRARVLTDVRAHLLAGSAKLREADTALQAELTATLPEARADIIAIPDEATESNLYELKIPVLGSIIASMSTTSKEVGLTSFPPQKPWPA